MESILGDRICVTANFCHGEIIPKSFVWKKKEYLIVAVGFCYRKQDGGVTLIYFAAVGQSATYELEFNPKTFIWTLTRVYLPG